MTDTSRETPVFVRFSTVQGSQGSADTVRDVRGFAVKFYTQEGNWDIVGNNIPVFFIQDAFKFTDLIHSVKPEPDTGVPQGQSAHNNFWDFAYLHSETTHMQQWTMSDRSIPRSFRMMQGFGVNTFCLINEEGKRTFTKFHFTPELGVHSFVWDEALKIAGQDPDFHRKDLIEAIDNGAFPKWKFGIQTLSEEQQDDFDFDILDATKLWPEDKIPVRYIGELELNRNIDEYFTQTEQVAFATSHIVPGIDFSNDPLLQGRNFSYNDTQLSRLGINWEELPINRPVCPMRNFNRDGAMRHRISKGSANYWPNRFEAYPPAKESEGGFVSHAEKIEGIKQRLSSAKFKEHYHQAQMFYNSVSEIERMHMMKAYSFELDHCDDPIVYERMVERIAMIDLSLAQSVAENVGAETPQKALKENKGQKTINVSQLDFMPEKPTIASRRIAILIGDGFDHASYQGMKAAITAAGALPFTIGTKRQPVKSATGETVKPDHSFPGMRSTLFDATYLPGGSHIGALSKLGNARFWITEAFGHLKAIAASGEAVPFVESLLKFPGVEFASSSSDGTVESYGVVTAHITSPESFKGVVDFAKSSKNFVENFFYQISQHRNWQRELDGLSDMVAC